MQRNGEVSAIGLCEVKIHNVKQSTNRITGVRLISDSRGRWCYLLQLASRPSGMLRQPLRSDACACLAMQDAAS